MSSDKNGQGKDVRQALDYALEQEQSNAALLAAPKNGPGLTDGFDREREREKARREHPLLAKLGLLPSLLPHPPKAPKKPGGFKIG